MGRKLKLKIPVPTLEYIQAEADAAAAESTTEHELNSDPHPQYQKESEKGQANGYAGLDAAGDVFDAQIPPTIARDSELPVPATAVPLVESGAGAVGVATKYAREDHVHPADGGGGGGATNLDDLLDVNAPAPADNDSLTWDAATSKWVPEAVSGGGGGGASVVGVKLSKSADQSIPNGAWTSITFNGEVSDDAGFHDNITNPSRVTIPAGKGGRYLVIGFISWQGHATGKRHIAVAKNGVRPINVFYDNRTWGSGVLNFAEPFVDIIECVAGDYLELQGFQDSGVALNAQATNTQFTAVLLGGGAGSQVGARAKRATTQSIPDATTTAVEFDEVDVFDTDAIHDPAVNPSRFTVPANKGGFWRITGVCQFAPNASGSRWMGWRKNGAGTTTWIAVMPAVPSVSIGTGCAGSDVIQLNAGDYIEVMAWQDAGAAVNLNPSTHASFMYEGPSSNMNTPVFTGARVFRSTAQTINNTAPLISWDTEEFDKGGFWDAAAPTRFTIPAGKGGFYRIKAKAIIASVSGRVQFVMRKNGVAIETGEAKIDTATFPSVEVDRMVELAAGDYIDVTAWSANSTTIRMGGYENGFEIQYLGSS